MHLDKRIVLKKNEHHRVAAGHPWVFSNEIRETAGSPAIGDITEVFSAGGVSLGIGMYNPHSLIAVRLCSKTVEEIDDSFFEKRLREALALREKLFSGSGSFRVVHGEADLLPGLVIDRYEDVVVVQTFAAGMDIRLPQICDVLDRVMHPVAIVERNESPLRSLETLPLRKGLIRGSVNGVTISQDGIKFEVDVLEGQKTGHFLDQRANRMAVRLYAPGADVLDCFCNDGGFSLHCAAAGAASVLAVDVSVAALARARRNAELNGCSSIAFEQGDAFDVLESLRHSDRTFDLIVLDPPSFAKSRKNVPAARKAYRNLNQLALNALKRNGILVTASCSHHITAESFQEEVRRAAGKIGRTLQLLEWRGAAPDHPILPGVPETAYLKLGIFRAL